MLTPTASNSSQANPDHYPYPDLDLNPGLDPDIDPDPDLDPDDNFDPDPDLDPYLDPDSDSTLTLTASDA